MLQSYSIFISITPLTLNLISFVFIFQDITVTGVFLLVVLGAELRA
jgi:hypothetical protein